MGRPTNKLGLSGVLTALAAIFSYVEALIPFSFGVPGIKLGLANVVIVFALYSIGPRFALLISVVRILVVSSLFGSPAIAMYSLAGALLSLAVMVPLQKTGKFSMIGVSMAGGVFHNIGQLVVAALVVEMAERGRRTTGLPRDASEAQVREALDWREAVNAGAWPWATYGPLVMEAVARTYRYLDPAEVEEQKKAAAAAEKKK